MFELFIWKITGVNYFQNYFYIVFNFKAEVEIFELQAKYHLNVASPSLPPFLGLEVCTARSKYGTHELHTLPLVFRSKALRCEIKIFELYLRRIILSPVWNLKLVCCKWWFGYRNGKQFEIIKRYSTRESRLDNMVFDFPYLVRKKTWAHEGMGVKIALHPIV